MKFYAAATFTHIIGFMYMSYFFRYRRLSMGPVLALSAAYYLAFDNVNNILYKTIVDARVLS
jgi:hypothetical protein